MWAAPTGNALPTLAVDLRILIVLDHECAVKA